jgi:hypothetical protein
MDIEHCVIAVPKRSCEVRYAADKTPLQRLSYMSCRPPLPIGGFGVFDDAKIRKLFGMAMKKVHHSVLRPSQQGLAGGSPIMGTVTIRKIPATRTGILLHTNL